MEDNKKTGYEAPRLTIATFKVEKGYAASSDWIQTLSLYELIGTGVGDQNIEDRGTATEWTW